MSSHLDAGGSAEMAKPVALRDSLEGRFGEGVNLGEDVS
jgi:hypothetical protein